MIRMKPHVINISLPTMWEWINYHLRMADGIKSGQASKESCITLVQGLLNCNIFEGSLKMQAIARKHPRFKWRGVLWREFSLFCAVFQRELKQIVFHWTIGSTLIRRKIFIELFLVNKTSCFQHISIIIVLGLGGLWRFGAAILASTFSRKTFDAETFWR